VGFLVGFLGGYTHKNPPLNPDWGCWLSLTTGLHSKDSGSTRILGQVSLGPAAVPLRCLKLAGLTIII